MNFDDNGDEAVESSAEEPQNYLEVPNAIYHLKNNKPDLDEVPAELIKYADGSGAKIDSSIELPDIVSF